MLRRGMARLDRRSCLGFRIQTRLRRDERDEYRAEEKKIRSGAWPVSVFTITHMSAVESMLCNSTWSSHKLEFNFLPNEPPSFNSSFAVRICQSLLSSELFRYQEYAECTCGVSTSSILALSLTINLKLQTTLDLLLAGHWPVGFHFGCFGEYFWLLSYISIIFCWLWKMKYWLSAHY